MYLNKVSLYLSLPVMGWVTLYSTVSEEFKLLWFIIKTSYTICIVKKEVIFSANFIKIQKNNSKNKVNTLPTKKPVKYTLQAQSFNILNT